MGIRLSEDEAWAELEQAHTGIHTTLKRDGWPVSLPTWFVVLDRRIYLRTPTRTKKVARLRRDPRGSFLVEQGERWTELRAVMVPVVASEVEPGEEHDRVAAAMSEKYRAYRAPLEQAPEATKRAYSGTTLLRLEPAGPPLTWDNARIRLKAHS